MLLPLVVSGVAAALVLDAFTGAPAAWRVVWWTGVVVCSIVAAVASVPVANRLSALGLLFGVDIDFPSPPPSRVRVAVGTKTMVAARNELARSRRADTDEMQTARMVAAAMVGVLRTMDVRVEDRVRVYSALGFAVCVAFASLIVVPDRAESPQSPFSTAPQADAPVTSGTTGPRATGLGTTGLGTTAPRPGPRGLPSSPEGASSGVTNSASSEQHPSTQPPTAAEGGATPIDSGDAVDVAGQTAGPTRSAAGPTPSSATSTVAPGPAGDVITVPVADNGAPDVAAATAPSLVPSLAPDVAAATAPSLVPSLAPDVAAATAPSVLPSLAPSGGEVAVAALAPVLPASAPPSLAAPAPDVVAASSPPSVPVAPSARSGGPDDAGARGQSPPPGADAPPTTPRGEGAAQAPHTDDDLQSAKAQGCGAPGTKQAEPS